VVELDELRSILSGLGEGVSLAGALGIKCASGDQLAMDWVRRVQSPECLVAARHASRRFQAGVECRVLHAAMSVISPTWAFTTNGATHMSWASRSVPDPTAGDNPHDIGPLLAWFRDTYPDEVREIEKQVRARPSWPERTPLSDNVPF
jgi:hypothetical protein